MKTYDVQISSQELECLISALLFSSSVNVASSVNADFPVALVALAKKLKALNSSIKLENVQFLKEENYEDEWSKEIFSEFENNMQIVNFEQV